ncbi:MAG: glycosyltransferase family 4 protein [Cellvibrionaceae bacterium]
MENTPTDRKKILFVAARLPYPTTEGHQIRTFGVLKQLAKYFDIHLISILREEDKLESNSPLYSLCQSVDVSFFKDSLLNKATSVGLSLLRKTPIVVERYRSENLGQLFKEKIKEYAPDIVHFDLLTLAWLKEFVPKDTPIVLNEHNVESNLVFQKAAIEKSKPMKLILDREAKVLTQFEKNSCQSIQNIITCSDDDLVDIEKFGAKNVHCIPNAMDISEMGYSSELPRSKKIVFLGGMAWYPNRLGMQWFLDEVMPLIIQKDSDVILQVVGNPKPSLTVSDSIKDNVEILGFVDDLNVVMNEARVFIVPLHVGSGTRLKVIEGMAYGKCIVSTRKGSEGIKLTDKESVYFADEVNTFSEAVIRCIDDDGLCRRLGANAREIAESTYDWNALGLKIRSIYSKV